MSRSTPRFCRSCGAVAPTGGRFCPVCGSSLNLSSPYPSPEALRRERDSQSGGVQGSDVPFVAAAPTLLAAPVVTPTVGGSVRMGFGIALGMLLFTITMAVVVGVAVAITTGLVRWPFAEEGQRFAGRGAADSAPIALEGPVQLEWSASPLGAACQFDSWLKVQNDAGFRVEIASTSIDKLQASGVPRRLDLPKRSDYYLSVQSDCDWTIRLTTP